MVSVWLEEYNIVSKEVGQAGDSGYGSRYNYEISHLGVDRFSKWLTESFCGAEIKEVPEGLFYGNWPGESGYFQDSFRQAAPYLKEEVAEIAVAAFKKAISAIDVNVISRQGVSEMMECAAMLGMKEEYEHLYPVQERKDDEETAKDWDALRPGLSRGPN